MGEFAKLWGTGDDQVVVLLQSDEEGKPEVRTFFNPPDLGVSSVAISFKDTDAGCDAAERMFVAQTEESTRNMIKKTLEKIGLGG